MSLLHNYMLPFQLISSVDAAFKQPFVGLSVHLSANEMVSVCNTSHIRWIRFEFWTYIVNGVEDALHVYFENNLKISSINIIMNSHIDSSPCIKHSLQKLFNNLSGCKMLMLCGEGV